MCNSVSKEILVFKFLRPSIAWSFALASSLMASPHCAAMQEWVKRVEQDSNAVEITHWKGLVLELQYADLYCGESRAFLHHRAAQKLAKALEILAREYPGYQLVVWDAARPIHVQQALWDQVRGTSRTAYVSNPRKGSLHNYGMAMDIAARKPDGSPVDMGGDFDEFSALSSASRIVLDSLVAVGRLSTRQLQNRQTFTQIMRRAGFIQLPSEWWHFNAARADWVRQNLRFLGEN